MLYAQDTLFTRARLGGKTSTNIEQQNLITEAEMKKLFLAILLGGTFIINAQTKTLFGYVYDKANHPLAFATLRIKESNIVRFSDKHGNFKISGLHSGKYTLIVSYVGHKTFRKKIQIKKEKEFILIKLESSPITLGEAVVIGLKVPDDAKNLPVPVASLNSKDLELNLPNSLGDALANIAGVNVARDGAWGSMINVRGLSKQNLVYLIDGARIETSTNIAGGLSLFNLDDIERAEVIKGGLSSLYGSGATGGVINIITKKSRYSESLYLKGTISTGYNSVNKGTSSSLEFFSGAKKWKSKFALSYRHASDIRIPEGYLQNSGFKDFSYTGSLGFRPFKKINIETEFQHYKATDVGIPGGAAFPPSATASYPEASRELFNIKINWQKPLPFLYNINIRYYSQFIRRIVKIVPAEGKSINPSSDHRTNGLSFEVQTSFGNNFLTFGSEAWRRTYNGIRIKKIEKPKQIELADKPLPNSEFAALGFFLNDNYQFSQRLELNFGGRYDLIRVKNEATSNPLYKKVDGKTVPSTPIPSASYSANTIYNYSWSGNLNLLYSLNKIYKLNVSLARTFRSPSLEERYQYIDLGNMVYLGNPDLQPEQSYSVNVGLRRYENHLSFELNAFANYFRDLVTDAAIVKDSLYKKENVGKARYYGFDAEMQYRFGNILLSANAGYVNAYDVQKDEPLPQIPPLNGKLSLNVPIKGYGNLSFQGIFFADQNNVPPTENRTGGYAVYNLYFVSRLFDFFPTKLKFHFGIENIFNRRYRNHLSTYRGIQLTEPGRNFYAKIFVNW